MRGNNEIALRQIRDSGWFDKHQITREGLGVWYCGERGTWCRHFRIIMVPGVIILTGDLGDMILRVYSAKPLRWALGSKFRPEYPYYPMSKLSQHSLNKEFKVDDATDYLKEQIKSARADGCRDVARRYIKALRRWKDFVYLDHPDRAKHEFYEILYEAGDDEPPDCMDHTLGTYYRYQALCWFMQHVDPNDDRFKEELKP